MSLPHALLGMISYGPATGYELKAWFTKSIAHFWNATLPQIYRTLSHLKSNGWVTFEVRHQEGKPSRKVYKLTETGSAELLRWLMEAPEIRQPKHPMLLKLFFGNRMDRNVVKGHIQAWREHHACLLARYEADVIPVIERTKTSWDMAEEGRFWSHTLDYGKRHAKMTVEWCDEVLRDLEEDGGERKPS
jgi:PadR family transcriptional regulator, regulatory protein AphA